MNCQFCKTPLTQQPGANTCARCFEYLDMTTGLPDLEYAHKCEAVAEDEDVDPTPYEHDEDDPYPDRVMVDASGRPHYEP